MALARFGVRGIGGGNLGLSAIPFDDGDANAGEIKALQKELGITLQDKRTDATLAAFTDPPKAFKNYTDARLIIDRQAVETYKKAGKQATDAGLPQDAAIDYAKRRATAYHAAEMELLNLTHPFADTEEGLVALASGMKRRDLLKAPAPAPNQG